MILSDVVVSMEETMKSSLFSTEWKGRVSVWLETIKKHLTKPQHESVNARLLEAASNLLTMRWDNQDRQENWQELSCAVAAARAQSADDELPVDEVWLREMNFLPDGDSNPPSQFGCRIWDCDDMESKEEPAMHVVFSFSEQSLWLETYAVNGNSLCLVEISRANTRGDVRRLLEALGINKE